jgi:hypothetical protein
MTGPAWLSDALAGVMIIVSGYCLVRLGLSVWQRRPTDRPVDAVHVLMGAAMVGMFVPSLRVTGTADWEVIFGVAITWFGWRWLRSFRTSSSADRLPWHHLQHLVGCAAMLYMLAVAVSVASRAPGSAAGAAMAGTGIPLPAFAFAFALLGFVIWTVDRMSGLAPVAALAAQAAAPSGPAAMLPAPAAMLPAPAAIAPAPTSGRAVVSPATGATRVLPAAGVMGTSPAVPASASATAPLSLRLAACCDIIMGLSMGYVLILMH